MEESSTEKDSAEKAIGKATLEKADCREEDRFAQLSRTDHLDGNVAAEQERVGSASAAKVGTETGR